MHKIKKHIALILIFTFGFTILLAAQEVETASVDSVKLLREEHKRQRGLSDLKTVFVPKGQYVFGMTGSYSLHNNNDYTFAIIEGISSTGYTVQVSPMFTYAIANNMTVGGRAAYSRSLVRIDDAALSFGDSDDGGINLTLNDYYSLTQKYSAMAIWRQYIPLGRSKRFALFNEMQFEVGSAKSKFAFDSPLKGTFSTSKTIGLGISPGVVAFATNDIAVEIVVGVLGASYTKTEQVHNQVEVGEVKSGMMNLKINIFSIGLGVSFYL